MKNSLKRWLTLNETIETRKVLQEEDLVSAKRQISVRKQSISNPRTPKNKLNTETNTLNLGYKIIDYPKEIIIFNSRTSKELSITKLAVIACTQANETLFSVDCNN